MQQMRPRTTWAAWDITVFNRDGLWQWRETDPAEAVAKARMQQFTPPITDHFGQKGVIRSILDGHPVTVWCHDGTQITIEPTIM